MPDIAAKIAELVPLRAACGDERGSAGTGVDELLLQGEPDIDRRLHWRRLGAVHR